MALIRTYLPAKMVEIQIENAIADSEDDVYSTPISNFRQRGFVFSDHLDTRHIFVFEAPRSEALQMVCSEKSRIDLVTEEEWEMSAYFPHNAWAAVAYDVIRLLGVKLP
jgi:hypothetical protein